MRAIVVGFLLVSGLVVAAPARADVAPARILLIGDSVMQGRAGDYTWRYRLWKSLEGARTYVDFVGPRRGEYNASTDPADYNDTTHYPDPAFDQDHAARWGGSMSYRIDDFDIPTVVADSAPDVVVNAEGLNDLVFWGRTPQELIDLMAQFVADVRAVRPGASIVIGQLPQRWATGVDEYDALLVDLAASLDTPQSRVVAARAPTDFTEYVDTYDPAHPTALGEMKIAQEYATALAELSLPSVPVPPPPPAPAPAPAPAAPYAGVAQLTAAGLWRSVRLAFTTPPGTTRQVIWKRERSAGSPWRAVASVSPATHRFRVKHLRSGHRYVFRLRAYQGDAASSSYSGVARARAR